MRVTEKQYERAQKLIAEWERTEWRLETKCSKCGEFGRCKGKGRATVKCEPCYYGNLYELVILLKYPSLTAPLVNW